MDKCNDQGFIKLKYLTPRRKDRQVFPLRLGAFA